MIWQRLITVIFILLLAGCSRIGPGTVTRDRFDYNTAVSDSWKEQTLLNIVKLRYADMPLFMDVASIVSGYTLESSVNIGGSLVEGSSNPGNLSLGTAGKYTDRPTITYAPITGAQFNKTFMAPLPPSAVLFMIQAGWPANIVLEISVEAINGLRAQKSGGIGQRVGDPRYYRMIELFTTIQQSGGFSVRVLSEKDEKETLFMVLRQSNVAPEIIAAGDELAGLLGMHRRAEEYKVAFGETAKNDKELAMLTRSLLSIMAELSGQIDVPAHHISEGRTVPSLAESGNIEQEVARRLISIRHSKDKPEDAFIAVKYKDYWFWIDDRDYKSKRTFAYLMILFSLTETGGKEGLPLVTIPAG